MTDTAKQTPIPLVDLAREHQPLRAELLAAMAAVLDDQRFILGPRVAAFEAAVAEVLGVPHAVGVASGTDALVVALLALGVGPGDEVITTPFTFFATAGAVARTGARPVFADIRPDTFNLDPASVEARVGERTRALLPVHLFGQMADMGALDGLAQGGDLPIVEDAAQALGAARDGTRAGAAGALGCFSFFPTKNLGCLGDGGLVTTRDETLDERVRLLRTHGSKDRRDYVQVGGNHRLDALQAALLHVKLPHLEPWNEARRANARRYGELFEQAGMVERGQVTPPAEAPGVHHIYHQYVVRVERRDALRAHLSERGVGTGIYYVAPLHLMACFEELGYRPGDLPHAEAAAGAVLALPIHEHLRGEELERVVGTMAEFYEAL